MHEKSFTIEHIIYSYPYYAHVITIGIRLSIIFRTFNHVM